MTREDKNKIKRRHTIFSTILYIILAIFVIFSFSGLYFKSVLTLMTQHLTLLFICSIILVPLVIFCMSYTAYLERKLNNYKKELQHGNI